MHTRTMCSRMNGRRRILVSVLPVMGVLWIGAAHGQEKTVGVSLQFVGFTNRSISAFPTFPPYPGTWERAATEERWERPVFVAMNTGSIPVVLTFGHPPEEYRTNG